MKRKVFISLLVTVFLTWCGLWTGIYADEGTGKESQLTVPWDEFKQLLHLDENVIVLPWETFQKLLEQTGTKTTPAHTFKEGNVVLTRTEFKKLVDQMKPPAEMDAQLPFDYLITKATYSGTMGNNNTAFTGIFHVHVLKKDAYVKIPLLPHGIALEDVKVGDTQALVVTENGFHNVVLSKSGEHVVATSFSLKSSLEKGPHKIDLNIQQTPMTLLRLEIPLKDIDVEIPQAQQVLTRLRGDTTVVSAVITPGRAISVRWRKKVAVVEKVPPKLYSEVYHLISIEDDALKFNTDINYNILHSEIDSVRLSIPEDMNVLSVQGEGVGEWQDVVQRDHHLILIPFTYGQKGAVTVRVTAEKALSDTGDITAFSGLQVLDTVRETGFIGVELRTSAEVKVTESEGLEAIAVQKLPRALYDKSIKPLMYGFKYLKHPYSLVLDVKRHEKIAVPVAAIDSGNVVTLFTEDGKIVHRLVYQVRNSAKQFLEIQLPEKADIWSVLVGNEPVEASINAEGKLLVPLIRSRSVDNRLDAFPVEVIYCLVENRLSVTGSLASGLPAIDLLISQLIWSVYLPNDYAYIYFASTLEKEEMIRGLNVFAVPQRRYDEKAMREVFQSVDPESQTIQRDQLKRVYKGKDYQSRFRNVPLQEEEISSQVTAELEFGGRLEGLAQQVAPSIAVPTGATGILPIQIQIPTGGQVYRFAKTIIKPEDPLTFSVTYTRLWVVKMVKWLIFVLIAFILYLNRKSLKRLWHRLKDILHVFMDWYKRHEDTLKRSAQSIVTPFVLFGLLIVFLFTSRVLTLLALFLLVVSVIYHLSRYRKRRTPVRTRPQRRRQTKTPIKKEGRR